MSAAASCSRENGALMVIAPSSHVPAESECTLSAPTQELIQFTELFLLQPQTPFGSSKLRNGLNVTFSSLRRLPLQSAYHDFAQGLSQVGFQILLGFSSTRSR